MDFKNLSSKATGFRDALRLGPRHAMERFALMTGVFGASFILIMGGAGATAWNKANQAINQTPIQVGKFTTSRSSASGSVLDMVVNSERTRALVVFELSDPALVSTNAQDYQVFGAITDEELSVEPLPAGTDGSISSLGSTGVFVVEITNPEGFDPEMIMLMIRANSELTSSEDTDQVMDALSVSNDTFATYDQFLLVVNPGATEAHVNDELAGEKADLGRIYNTLVVGPREEEIREQMFQEIKDLQLGKARAQEYERRLAATKIDGSPVVVPKAPKVMRDDEFTCVSGDVETIAQCPAEDLRYEPGWTYPNGFDFHWQDRSLETGYLNQVVPEDAEALTWLTQHAKAEGDESDQEIIEQAMTVGQDPQTWKLENGSYISDFDPTLTPVVTTLQSISQLTQSWNNYTTAKEAYQVDSYNDLLNLEVELSDVKSSSTVHDSDEAFIAHQ